MEPALQTLKIIVTDRNGGRVDGANVYARFWSDERPQPVMTTDGAATIFVPQDADVVTVIALKSGVGLDYWEPDEHLEKSRHSGLKPSAMPDRVTLVLDGAKTVRVLVKGSDGNPLEGTLVGPWFLTKRGKRADVNLSGLTFAMVKTDPNGIAAFDWFPQSHVGVTPFLVCGDYEGRTKPDLTGDDPDGVLLVAAAQKLTELSGRAVFHDGRPAASILLQIEGGSCSSYFRGQTRTGADGGYSAKVYPNRSYLVSIIDEDWAATRTGVFVREGEPLEGIDLELRKGTVIHGHLTCGKKNEPAAGETITLVQVGAGDCEASGKASSCGTSRLVRWAKTDEEGRYSFRVAAGCYELMEPSGAASREFVVADEVEIVQDFHMVAPPRGMLDGTVVEKATGKPVAGAVVRDCSAKSGHVGVEATCDETGRFSKERWQDRMLVWAYSPDGTLAGTTEIAETDTEVHVAVEPSVVAEVKVVDKDGKIFVGGRPLYWMTLRPDEGTEFRYQVETETDESGVLRMPGLIPGATCQCIVFRGWESILGRSEDFVADRGKVGRLRLPDIVCDPTAP